MLEILAHLVILLKPSGVMANPVLRLKQLLTVWMIIFPLQRIFCADVPVDFSLNVVGGAHRIFRQGIDLPKLEVIAWSKDGAPHDLNLSFQIQDLFGRQAATLPSLIFHVPEDASKARAVVPLGLGVGYYTITAHPPQLVLCVQRFSSTGRRPAAAGDDRDEGSTNTLCPAGRYQEPEMAQRVSAGSGSANVF